MLKSDIRLHILIVFKDNSTILTEIIVLRRILNYSEEDISGNDSSEEDKSEEDNQLF